MDHILTLILLVFTHGLSLSAGTGMCINVCHLIAVIVLTAYSHYKYVHISEEPYGVEYCPFERFKASCSANEIIMITHARYGRMRIGKCIHSEEGTGKH